MNFQADVELAKRALAGEEAALVHLRDEVIPSCLAAMLSRCSDGRSRERAREIADDLFGKIVHVDGVRRERKNILEAYEGRSSLKTWMQKIALSELRDWWKSPRATKVGSLEDLAGEDGDPDDFLKDETDAEPDAEAMRIGGESMRAAVASLEPMLWTLVQLTWLHSVEKQSLAKVLKHDKATSGRWVKDSVESIGKAFAVEVKTRDPNLDLTLQDFLKFCRGRVDAAQTLFELPER